MWNLDLPDALLDASDSLHNGGLVPVGSFWDMNLVSESFVCIQWFHQSSDMLAQIPAPVVSDALSCNTTGKNRGCPRVQRIDVESAPSPTAPVVCAESKTPCYGGYWDTVGNNCLGYSVNRTRNQSIHGSNCSLSKSVGRASLKPFGFAALPSFLIAIILLWSPRPPPLAAPVILMPPPLSPPE